MNVAVESDGARISLKSGKQHFTLYSSDLEHLWEDANLTEIEDID